VSKSLKKAKLGMLHDNENESCNAPFVHNNIEIKGI